MIRETLRSLLYLKRAFLLPDPSYLAIAVVLWLAIVGGMALGLMFWRLL